MGTPIQKLFTDNKLLANGATFVGEKNRLWYDPLTGFRVSDGRTPGGKPALISVSTASIGDLIITGGNITTINTNENLGLISNGTGTITVIGAFNVSTVSGQQSFNIDGGGHVKIIDSVVDLNPSLAIVNNSSGTVQSPQNSGVVFQATGGTGIPSRIYNDGVANYSAYIGRRYDGTSSVPTQVLSGEEILRIGATPYTNTGWPSTSTARIQFLATENQTGTAQGNQIVFATVAIGSTTVTPIATIDSNGIYPSADNVYYLGSASKRWKGLNLGPGTLYITDQTLNTQVGLSVNNGVLLVNGANQLQVGQLKFVDNTIESITGSTDIQIGLTTSTANLVLNRNVVLAAGKSLTFSDSTTQTTAAIPLGQKASPLGVATLGGDGKLLSSQIPASLTSAVIFAGAWNPITNTPTLANGSGSTGTEYVVVSTSSFTRNLGAGNQLYTPGDYVIYGNGVWNWIQQSSPVASVTATNHISVNTSTGVIIVTSDATNLNTAGTIVTRDASGNFLAGTITANLTGTASLATNATTATSAATAYSTVNVHTAGTGLSGSTFNGSTAVTWTLNTATLMNTSTWATTATFATTATNAGYAYSFNTGTLVANAVTAGYATTAPYATTATVIALIANSLTNTITAGYDISVTTSTGTVTVSNILQSASTTQASTLTVDFTGPGVIFWKPSANGNRSITLINFTPGRRIKLWITPNTAPNTFTFTGATASQFSNGSITFQLAGGGAGQTSMMIELFSTTSAIGGVWAFAYGGV